MIDNNAFFTVVMRGMVISMRWALIRHNTIQDSVKWPDTMI